MVARSIAFVLATAIVACGGRSLSASGDDLDVTRLGACPYRTAEEWQSYIDRTAQGAQWEETCDDGPCTDAYESVRENVARVFGQCDAFLADNPRIDSCADHLRRFSASWLEQHDPLTYGFAGDDDAYFASQTAPDVPPLMMAPRAELLSQMPDLAKVEDAARRHGWPYVVQESCLGNDRLYVLVPDPSGRFDQWTLMNVANATPATVNGRVSLLAVQKTDAIGEPLAKVRVHFRDYLVKTSPGGGKTATSDAADNAKCYSCHTSGVRQLIGIRTPELDAKPVMGQAGFTDDGSIVPTDFAFQQLTLLNDRLGSYGLNDWNGAIVVSDFGPVLGAKQGCTACHDGRTRGVLTVSTSLKQIQHKMTAELAMPPSPGLVELVERQSMQDPPLVPGEQSALQSATEVHAALLADFEAERAPALRAWLLATRCSP